MPRRAPLPLLTAIAMFLTSVALADSPTPGGIPATAQARRPAVSAIARPLTADESAVADLRLAGQHNVQACVVRLASAPDMASRDAIQREIIAIKRQTELDVLSRLATLARSRGDIKRAQSFEEAATQLRSPKPLGLPAAPAKAAPTAASVREGGAR